MKNKKTSLSFVIKTIQGGFSLANFISNHSIIYIDSLNSLLL